MCVCVCVCVLGPKWNSDTALPDPFGNSMTSLGWRGRWHPPPVSLHSIPPIVIFAGGHPSFSTSVQMFTHLAWWPGHSALVAWWPATNKPQQPNDYAYLSQQKSATHQKEPVSQLTCTNPHHLPLPHCMITTTRICFWRTSRPACYGSCRLPAALSAPCAVRARAASRRREGDPIRPPRPRPRGPPGRGS